MDSSRKRAHMGGRSPHIGASSFGHNYSNNGHTPFASSSHLGIGPTGSSSNEANAFSLAQQARHARAESGPRQQAQELLQRGNSPLIAAAQVDAVRRNGLGIRSPPPEHTAASSNNLQLPMGDRHRSASPFGGSGGGFSRAQSPRSPHLSPYMATQGLLSPPAASFNNGAFNSFDSAGSSERANIPIPSPGADSSWSYSVEEADVARQKAEKAARQRQGSVASSIGHRTTHVQPDELRCRGKRKTKRDDNATYRRGDDEFEPDSDDNPDPTAGVVQNGGLRPRHRSTGIDLGNGPQAFKPPTRKGQSATMAAVPEDEGLEQEDFDHYDDGDDGDNGMTPTAGQPRSPMHYQVLVPDTTLPQTYRQPTQWEHLMHDAQRWGRGCLDLARASKNGAFVVLLLAALLWWSFLLRSSPAAPASKVAPQPLPDNFNAFAGRLGELETSYAKSQSDIAGTWDSLDDRLSRLEAEQYVLSDLKQQQAAVMADNRRTKEQMGATIGRVDKLEHRVDSLEKHVSKAINDGSLRDALRRILPDTVPALRSKGGGWDIDDGFFAVFVKRLLYGSGSLEQEIRHLVNQGVAVESKRWAGDRHGDAKRLEERVAQMLDSHGSDVLVGRDDFITIFEDKIQELWRELKSVEANAQTAPTAMKIKTSDGEDLTGMMQSLIDASLLRHSNDQLGRVDYALFSAGARVIEATTTPTLQISGVGLLGRIWGAKPLLARQPRVALHPDTTVGQCWAFAGSSGDLGVMLSEPNVVIDAITIDHVAKAIVTDISSAPRDIEVWVNIEGEENQEKARRYLETSPYRDEPTSLTQTDQNILLAKVVYDIYSTTPTQTFSVPKLFTDLGITTRFVTFRVLSNWGSDITCIYRVRVHGAHGETATAESAPNNA